MDAVEERLTAVENKLDNILTQLLELNEERNADKRFSISEVCKRLKIGRRRLETLIYRFHLGIDTRRQRYADGCINPKISYKQMQQLEKILKIQRGDV